MKTIVTILALAAAAAAQAQTVTNERGEVHAVMLPGTAKGYMNVTRGVAQYEQMIQKYPSRSFTRVVVIGCDGAAPGEIVDLDASNGAPKWEPWHPDGKGVNDQLAREVCKAGLVWLRQGGKL